MSENKWIGFSRSLWSALLPLILLALNAAGVTNADNIGAIASRVVEGGIVVAALVLQYLHQRDPKPTTLG